ncbi:MAG TPA: hypothetical protein VFZ65_01090 [Planctomycetota bacterium]|nr:hypothetical protein [Planctomycetota bacterium]
MHMRSFVAVLLIGAPTAAQANWSMLYPAASPPPVNSPSMACFEPTGEVVLLFGIAGAPATQGWRLVGATWSPFPMPAQTGYGRGMVYDSARQRLVVFGGNGPANDDTWEWNGASWLHPTPAVRPAARTNFAMAFDRTRGVAVVFGGNDGSGQHLQDLWEWNGVTWTQRAAVSPLGPRARVLGAFDPVHRNVLLYGGTRPFAGTTQVFNDTWAWDGTSFTQYAPPVPPPYLQEAAIVSDLHRQRVILYGGVPADGVTREWTGAEWVDHTVPSPGPRISHALAYDTGLRRTVLFGGTSSGSFVQDTWIHRTQLPADVAPFGSGCAGTAGTPELAAAPFTLPWLGDTMRNVVQTIPATEPGAVFVSSLGNTPPVPLGGVGMPGCDLLVPLDVVEFRAAAAGRAEWALSIPNTPSLAAVSFRQQAFVLDAAANAVGLTASNAVLVTTGVR